MMSIQEFRTISYMVVIVLFSFVGIIGIQAQNPDIFITNFQTDAVARFDGNNGDFLGNFVAPGFGGLDQPQKVLFHPNGNLLVTGFFNSAVKMYNGQTGSFISDFTSGYSLNSPTKMIMGKDSILFVSQWDGKVVRFDYEGQFIDEFTSTSIPAGLGMEWDDEGNLYVAGWGTNGFDGAVYKFDPQGNSMGVFINSDLLQGPVGIWRDEEGDFFVVDWRLGSVLRFDQNGAFTNTFIDGSERTEGHAFGHDGSIFLCNVSANQVSSYQPDGTFNEIFINSNLAGPNSITFGPTEVMTSQIDLSVAYQIQILPNPFTDQLFIQFDLPNSNQVEIQVTDIFGRLVTTIADNRLNFGFHSFNWSVTNEPSQLYFVHLKFDGEHIVETVVLRQN